MNDEVLVKAEGVSKKFCRSLKRSLWYGVQDVTSELMGRDGHRNQLRKNEFWAVKDVSFELRRGECLGLIGPNGAGKSTMLKMLNGLVKPDEGSISMKGRVGALIELGAGFDPILSARENIFINASVLGFTKKEIERKFESIVEFAEIESFLDTPIQNFSSGMKVRLGFSIAAQLEPDVLVIDEVLAVGDTGFRAKCFNLISQISQNCALIFVSHSMPDISRSSSCVMVIDSGKSIYQGTDVSSGIEVYSSIFQQVSSHGNETQDCRLVSAELSSVTQSPNSNFLINHLDTLNIRLDLMLDIGDRSALINLSIEDVQKRSVAQIASVKNEFVLQGSKKTQSIDIEIPKIPLSLGKYSLSVYCVERLDENRRGEIFFFKHNVAYFNVFDSNPGYSAIQIPASWKYSDS